VTGFSRLETLRCDGTSPGPAISTGDGKSDILWINDNNTPAIWELNGTSIISAVALSGIADSS
jgi:hypothetical protein